MQISVTPSSSSNALEDNLHSEGSVVTISISTTKMAAENYGYMAPIKAALDSTVVFSEELCDFSNVRFNAVAPGLQDEFVGGIPGYVDSYLFAEEVIPRKAWREHARGCEFGRVLVVGAFGRHQRQTS